MEPSARQIPRRPRTPAREQRPAYPVPVNFQASLGCPPLPSLEAPCSYVCSVRIKMNVKKPQLRNLPNPSSLVKSAHNSLGLRCNLSRLSSAHAPQPWARPLLIKPGILPLCSSTTFDTVHARFPHSVSGVSGLASPPPTVTCLDLEPNTLPPKRASEVRLLASSLVWSMHFASIALGEVEMRGEVGSLFFPVIFLVIKLLVCI